MKKGIVFLTVTLLLVFGIVQVAAAAGMGWGGEGPRMLNSDKWVSPVEELNLTDEQINKIREINQNTYEKTRDLRIKLMDSMHEFKQLQLQKNPDKTKVEAKIKEINDMRDQIRGIVQQGREQCRSLLTQEQRDQVNQFRGKKGGGFRGCFGW